MKGGHCERQDEFARCELGGAICQLPSLTALLSAIPVLIIAVLFAFVPVPDAHAAAAAYLADENSQTEISVDVDDTFYVVLYVVDISGVAGYECKIDVTGPATATGSAAHGAWVADNHTLFGPYEPCEGEEEVPAPPDYQTAMLLSPAAISGSGAVVVYTLHADDDGVVAINVDEDYFLFASSSGTVIELDLPSTLYVTVGSGGGDSFGQQPEEDQTIGQGDGILDEPMDELIYYELKITATDGEDELTGVDITGHVFGHSTIWYHNIPAGVKVNLRATAFHSELAFHHWRLEWPSEYPEHQVDYSLGELDVSFIMPEAGAVVTAIYSPNVIWVNYNNDPQHEDGSAEYPYDTIQEGIDDVPSQSSDYIVIVRGGEYTGSGNRDISFAGKAVLLRSYPEEECIINCQGSVNDPHRAFVLTNGETTSSAIRGFRVTNGYAPATIDGKRYGAAIYCANSSPLIADNIITGNTAITGGGGVYCAQYSSPEICGNTISNNTGGDIHALESIAVIGNLITGNDTEASNNYGGGVRCTGSSPTISGNIIAGNNSWFAGGVLCDSSSSQASSIPVITGNLILNNSGFFGGGGLSSNSGIIEANSIIGKNHLKARQTELPSSWLRKGRPPSILSLLVTGASGAKVAHCQNQRSSRR